MEEYFKHFPKGISEDIKQYAIDEALKHSRYIFTWRIGKQQLGYCTHCRKNFPTSYTLIHNHEAVCPKCGSICKAKSSGRGRGRMVDEVYFVYYEKSLIDPAVITARGFFAVRDYRKDYHKVQTEYEEIARYVFKMGGSEMYYKRHRWNSLNAKWTYVFESASKIFSLFNKDRIAYFPKFYSRKNIESVVQGTPFQYSTWNHYDHDDMTVFFGLYSKYPCIEYLTKLDMDGLVQDKLNGYPTHSAINWNGKTLLNVLRMKKQDFNTIRQQKIEVTFSFLKVYQMSNKLGWDLSLSEIGGIDKCYFRYLDDLRKLTFYGSIKKMIGYINKQYQNYRKNFFEEDQVLIAWRDYIENCQQLGLDLTRERVVFPKNVYAAHQKTIGLVKLKADKELRQKIETRVESLKKLYYWEHNGLVIRPVMNYEDIVNEGKTLHHCVATNYTHSHAEGRTSILFIRQISEPDKPFYTVEVKDNRIIQVQGLYHCAPTKEVKEFIKVFEAKKLKKSSRKAKLKQSA